MKNIFTLYLQTENIAELMKDRMKIVEREYSSSENEELEKLVVDTREKEKWDCESILSTYSNIYNHPKLIPEPSKVSYFIMSYTIYNACKLIYSTRKYLIMYNF